MKKKVLVTLPVNDGHKKYLEQCLAGGEEEYELVFTDGKDPSDEQLAESTVLLGIYNPAWPCKAGNVEWVQLASAGSDAFTAPGVLKEGVRLTSAVGAYGLSVSEHMMAQTFYMIRRLGAYTRNQLERRWADAGPNISIEGSVIAVLGMGDIGTAYATRVKALGAYVIGVRRSNGDKPECFDEQYTVADIDKVLPRADIVAMILPGSEETYHLINEEKLRMMKKEAYILNAGRGNALDLAALKKVMKEGHLAGAALDVTEPEPLPADDELWDYENVLITPHSAGGLHVKETLNRIVKIIGENLAHWIKQEPLKNVVR